MPIRLPQPRLILVTIRQHARAYSSSPAPTIKSTSIPAPHAGSIRILSLNRPQARNAISRTLLAELAKEIQSVAAEGQNGPTRALILASESDAAFCAGADLKERLTFTAEEYVGLVLLALMDPEERKQMNEVQRSGIETKFKAKQRMNRATETSAFTARIANN